SSLKTRTSWRAAARFSGATGVVGVCARTGPAANKAAAKTATTKERINFSSLHKLAIRAARGCENESSRVRKAGLWPATANTVDNTQPRAGTLTQRHVCLVGATVQRVESMWPRP